MRRHHTRLEALERAIEDFLIDAPCGSCGGPRADGSAVYLLECGEELAKCATCGGFLDPGNVPLGALWRGRVLLTIVHLIPVDQDEGPDPPIDEITRDHPQNTQRSAPS